MGEHELASGGSGLRNDQRGVIYVEHVVLVAGGLLLAGLLGAAGTYLVASRFERITDALHSGSP
jgi:hypothetical protein